MQSGTFRRMIHDFMLDFLMIAVAELLEIGFAALAVIMLAAIASLY